MFTFLIISDNEHITEKIFEAFSLIGKFKKQTEGRILVESPTGSEDGWIALQYLDNIQNDYEADELEAIKIQIKNPLFYLIEGRDGKNNFSNAFIQNFQPDSKVLVDNDHGLIVDLFKIKEKIKSGLDWLHSPF